MGGHGQKYPPVLIDPAIEKHYHLHDMSQTHFRFTPRIVRNSIILTLVIPGLLWWASWETEGSIRPAGVRRGEEWFVLRHKKNLADIRQEEIDEAKGIPRKPNLV
ncbi:hypothetical protein HDV00_004225 [Rhizophlyctis rosea]|nr:hypothetical protein HDV00_004225 [Rhizophlyctis rosea]